MSEKTNIQWCDATWSPWIGCTKISSGCANCYADSRGWRKFWGKGVPRHRTSDDYWKKPKRWNNDATFQQVDLYSGDSFRGNESEMEALLIPSQSINSAGPARRRVFPSLCDWLDDEVPIEWLADFLQLIHDTPNLTWLLLTKRPENVNPRLSAACMDFKRRCLATGAPFDHALSFVSRWLNGSNIPRNVWIGTSCENQEMADKRIPELLKIPAKVRFLSLEPLLEEIDLGSGEYHCLSGCGSEEKPGFGTQGVIGPKVDWVIVGGESGKKARPCNVAWIRSIVDQCKSAGVPCFVKQLGSRAGADNCGPWLDWHLKHKGEDMSQWSEDLRVREFPNGIFQPSLTPKTGE